MNEEYCINEKKAVHMIDGFDMKPPNYKKRIDEIITRISWGVENAGQAVGMLEEIMGNTEKFVNS